MGKQIRGFLTAVCMIMIFGAFSLKDTGVFVKEAVIEKDGNVYEFIDGETVEIIRTQQDHYLIVKDSSAVEVPLDAVLKLTESTQKYQTNKPVNVLKDPNGEIISVVPEDNVMQILKEEDYFGLFELTNGEKGYVYMTDVEQIENSVVTTALALVDEELVNGSNKLNVNNGSSVSIKNYLSGTYIIVDKDGNEFLLSSSKVKLATANEIKEAANRSKPVAEKVQDGSKAEKLIAYAKAQLGKPYSYGSSGPRSFDCSGFTSYVYKNSLGIGLSRTSGSQAGNGYKVSRSALQPGDLLFFNTTGRGISHVGIYMGDGQMIHASSGSNMKVMISSINSGYYSSRYVSARRIID